MVSTAPDGRKSDGVRPGLAQVIDRQIKRALHKLGEAGAEELGPSKYSLRGKGARKETLDEVRDDFSRQIGKWQGDYAGAGNEVFFFQCMRESCWDLYDNTNAWDTIYALAAAVSMAISSQLKKGTAGADRVLLEAISQSLSLLQDDIAIFQGLNQGSNHSVIRNSSAAQRKAQGLLATLDPDVSGTRFAGERAELQKELRAEAHAMHEAYRGIHCAAVALADHEDAIQKYYHGHPDGDDVPSASPASEPAHAGPEADSAGADDPPDETGHWRDHRRTKSLHDARGQVRTIIRRLDEEQSKNGAPERAKGYASVLKPWESLLRSVAAAYQRSKQPMRLPTVQIRYCFPFAVKVEEDTLSKLSPALRKRLPGVRAADGRGGASEQDDSVPRLDRDLQEKLDSLYQGTATVQAMQLTDFWAGAGEGMYGGNRVALPAFSDMHNSKNEWRVWIDLSRLENHCLCIERTLTDPTPHELYKALRCPADYSRDSEYRYGWAKHQSGHWRSLDEFAHDVILVVAQGLTDPARLEYIKGHCHIIVLVDADISGTALDGLYGAEILRTNVNRDAATLEEWVRYPVAGQKGKSEVARGNFGYKENWWSVIDDATIFGAAGNPFWQADAFLEAVQFAASWSPRLLLWNRELLQTLEQRPGKKQLPDLRRLEQEVRHSVAAAHAEELCRLRSDRRYLEWMMEAVGTTDIQEDLERRINAMRLLINEAEKNQQDGMDTRRNLFLGAIALFGVLNVSTLFAVLDAGDNRGIFRTHAAIRGELIAQAVIFVLVVGTWVGVEWWRKSTK